MWFAENDSFCCKLLNHHWPSVSNLGDVTDPEFQKKAGEVDLIIGGSPCPSFSAAGKKKGMQDPRGLLSLRYCELVRQIRPKWFIWENVPGVITSNKGQAFEVIANEMVNSGYGICWRVLDARQFGLPQSRKRLFVVGRLGRECPRQVLFVAEDLQNVVEKHANIQSDSPPKTLGVDVVPMCFRGRKCGSVIEQMTYFGCLRTGPGHARNHVWDGKGIRKLTPVECERLQGMPDNHTNVCGASENVRMQAIGNSMAVPLIRWIGSKITAAENEKPS